MLRLSQRLNPECEHRRGDMRSVRLGRTFDAVLVQDAVLYLTTEDDLRRAMATAFVHCRPGGVALFAPDYVRETFAPATTHGGHDGAGRAMRYLAWIRDPDPADTTYVVDFAYLLHEDGRPTRSAYDRHVHGLFGRADWLRLLEEAGFRPAERPFAHSELPAGAVTVFVARRPEGRSRAPPLPPEPRSDRRRPAGTAERQRRRQVAASPALGSGRERAGRGAAGSAPRHLVGLRRSSWTIGPSRWRRLWPGACSTRSCPCCWASWPCWASCWATRRRRPRPRRCCWRRCLPGRAGWCSESFAAIEQAAGVAGLVSLGLLLFNGSNFFVTLELVFDLAYHVPERHPLTQRLVSVVALMVLTGLVLLATGAAAVGGVFGQALSTAIPWLGAVIDAGLAAAVSVAGLVASFVLLYWGLPNARISLRQALPGALVSSALFVAVLRIFPLYVALFGQGFSVYTAFGTVLLFMFWLYIVGVVLVGGAELNAFLRDPEGSVAVSALAARAVTGGWTCHPRTVSRRRAGPKGVPMLGSPPCWPGGSHDRWSARAAGRRAPRAPSGWRQAPGPPRLE